jgi:HKD family nuclease
MIQALPLASLTMPTSKPDVHFLDSRPGKPADLGVAVRTAYSRGDSDMYARFAFAYATSSGLQAMLPVFSQFGTWEGTEKKWVIGVHHGITEPRALRELLSLSNSKARVFVNGKQLTKESLASSKKLHAKIFCIECGSDKKLSALVAGSANLTGAALGRTSQNYEVGLAYLPGNPASIASSLDAWWAEVWKNSINLTEKLIDDYSLLRQQFIARNPDVVHDLEAPSELDAAHAKSLWMEAGAMSGGSRNQIEFGRELAAFFGPVENHQRLLVMRSGGTIWKDRPLSPKRTTFGVPIWRLSLPTSYQGAQSYPGKIVKLTRSSVGGSEVFRIDVVDAHSPRHLRWLRESHRDGHFSATSGGRQFGLA